MWKRKTMSVIGVVVLVSITNVALGEVVYVDADAPGPHDGSSWTKAYEYLQDALTDADSDPNVTEIWVAEGTYIPSKKTDPSDPRSATFTLVEGVAMYGGYAGYGAPDPNARNIELYETILSGDLDGNDVDVNDPRDLRTEPTRDDNSYNVVAGAGTADTVLDGFTISGGHADDETAGLSPYAHKQLGAGMYNVDASPTVNNCKFAENYAYHRGGGLFAYGGWLPCSEPIVTECVFKRNYTQHNGGGICCWHSGGTFARCTISDNKSGFCGPAGVFLADAWTVLENCIVSKNYKYDPGQGGGGVTVGGDYNLEKHPKIRNCVITENHSEGDGGGIYTLGGTMLELSNCTITFNTAGYDGGGIYNLGSNSDPIVTNCTLSRNSGERGGGMYNNGSSPTVTNCVFWHDDANDYGDEIYNLGDSSEPYISYCDIEGCGAPNDWDPNLSRNA